MEILVTGHAGYLGSVLLPRLAERGHRVTGLDCDLFATCAVAERPACPRVRRLDVRDVEPRHLEGVDAVIHLAGLSNDPLGDLDPATTDAINHRATVRLAEAARAAGVGRFLFASTCSAYGQAPDDLVTEETPPRPVTAYARSKVAAETGLTRLAGDGFSPTSLRLATVYGASPMLRFDLVVNNLVAWGYTTNEVLLKSDGTPWRPLVHAQDVAEAFCRVLEAPRPAIHGRTFNVGATGHNYRIREVAEAVCGALPQARLAFRPEAGPDRRSYRVDCQRIAEELGFCAAWTLPDGVAELIEVYQRLQLTEEDFRGPRHRRVPHLQALLAAGRLTTELRWRTPDALPGL